MRQFTMPPVPNEVCFSPVSPWPIPHRKSGSSTTAWTCPTERESLGLGTSGRRGFDQYIGNYTLSALHRAISPLPGGLACHGLGTGDFREVCLIPFQGNADGSDRSNWDMGYEASCLNRLKSSSGTLGTSSTAALKPFMRQ